MFGSVIGHLCFGMLEDVLSKFGARTGKSAGDKGSEQSLLFSRARPTVVEVVDSRSFYSLPTITESFGSDPSTGDPSQHPSNRLQIDAALGFSQTQVTDITGSDSWKTSGQIRFDARKKSNSYKWSSEERPNTILRSGSDDGRYMFTEEMLEIAPFAKMFATGLENS